MSRPQFRLRSLLVAMTIAAVLSAFGAPALAKLLRERNNRPFAPPDGSLWDFPFPPPSTSGWEGCLGPDLNRDAKAD
jgi:hypothetical protein